MLVDADKRIYGDVTGKTLEAIAAQGYSYKDGQLEKQQPEATPDSLLTGETVRTPRGNFHITDMSREQIEAAGFGFHHASEDGEVSHYGKWHTGLCHSRRAAAAG